MKGIIPANVSDSLGSFWNYASIGQIQTNLGHIRTELVPNRPGALASIDFVTCDLNSHEPFLIECFDCKVVTFERLSDGFRQPVQCWCMVGNKDAEENFAPLMPAYFKPIPFGGAPESYIHFDLNRDGKPDGLENSFRVRVANDLGTPWILHEIYDQYYIIESWEKNPPAWGGARYFWAAWHHGVKDVTNEQWADEPPATTKPALYYEEAFWMPNAGWMNGHGAEPVMQADGLKWPRGAVSDGAASDGDGAYAYGRYESTAQGVPWMWYVHGWAGADDQIWDEYAIKREPMDH